MADPAELLASTEESLKKVAAEIERLWQSAETAWQAYQGAERGQKSAAKEYWQAAVREKEAARMEKGVLLAERLAERKAVIERLPTGGQHAVESSNASPRGDRFKLACEQIRPEERKARL